LLSGGHYEKLNSQKITKGNISLFYVNISITYKQCRYTLPDSPSTMNIENIPSDNCAFEELSLAEFSIGGSSARRRGSSVLTTTNAGGEFVDLTRGQYRVISTC
jgi:hypothetical protein